MISCLKEKFNDENVLYLRIKAMPNSSKTVLKEIMEDGTLKINIAAVPEKNKANEALTRFLAKEFSVDKTNIAIISGSVSRIKLIKITR